MSGKEIEAELGRLREAIGAAQEDLETRTQVEGLAREALSVVEGEIDGARVVRAGEFEQRFGAATLALRDAEAARAVAEEAVHTARTALADYLAGQVKDYLASDYRDLQRVGFGLQGVVESEFRHLLQKVYQAFEPVEKQRREHNALLAERLGGIEFLGLPLPSKLRFAAEPGLPGSISFREGRATGNDILRAVAPGIPEFGAADGFSALVGLIGRYCGQRARETMGHVHYSSDRPEPGEKKFERYFMTGGTSDGEG